MRASPPRFRILTACPSSSMFRFTSAANRARRCRSFGLISSSSFELCADPDDARENLLAPRLPRKARFAFKTSHIEPRSDKPVRNLGFRDFRDAQQDAFTCEDRDRSPVKLVVIRRNLFSVLQNGLQFRRVSERTPVSG